MACCRQCIVSGLVQGVFFRRHTIKEATKLGVTGWVRNLRNGNVEVVVCGDEETVDIFCEWLWEGSPSARVDEVEIREHPYEEYDKFKMI